MALPLKLPIPDPKGRYASAQARSPAFSAGPRGRRAAMAEGLRVVGLERAAPTSAILDETERLHALTDR